MTFGAKARYTSEKHEGSVDIEDAHDIPISQIPWLIVKLQHFVDVEVEQNAPWTKDDEVLHPDPHPPNQTGVACSRRPLIGDHRPGVRIAHTSEADVYPCLKCGLVFWLPKLERS